MYNTYICMYMNTGSLSSTRVCMYLYVLTELREVEVVFQNVLEFSSHTGHEYPLTTHYTSQKGGCASEYVHMYLQVDVDRVEYTYWVGSCPLTTLLEVSSTLNKMGIQFRTGPSQKKPIFLPIQLLQCSPG